MITHKLVCVQANLVFGTQRNCLTLFEQMIFLNLYLSFTHLSATHAANLTSGNTARQKIAAEKLILLVSSWPDTAVNAWGAKPFIWLSRKWKVVLQKLTPSSRNKYVTRIWWHKLLKWDKSLFFLIKRGHGCGAWICWCEFTEYFCSLGSAEGLRALVWLPAARREHRYFIGRFGD